MKNGLIRLILMTGGSMPALILSGCCSVNQLQGHEFNERTASALLAPPPPAGVFTDGWAEPDFDNPIQAVIQIGTGIAREVEAGKTRAKMDSALGMVDIPDILQAETLERGSKTLRFRPIEDTDRSDYLFELVIEKYGIEAKSWTSGVDFRLEAKITLFENSKRRQIWRHCFDEKVAVSRDIFGLPGAANNVITMITLSRLTPNQIADGLENLAVRTSDRIIRRLQEDFAKKNR
jgi:hypothetical protein